jgi:hypothetical protein
MREVELREREAGGMREIVAQAESEQLAARVVEGRLGGFSAVFRWEIRGMDRRVGLMDGAAGLVKLRGG